MVKASGRWAITDVIVVCALAEVLSAQPPPAPAFEVTSVKPAAQELLLQKGFQCGFTPGGRFARLGTLQWLIGCAYGIPAARAGQEISGGPKWLNDALFVIAATAPPDHVPRSNPEGLVMLRTLLADRFKLVVHAIRNSAMTLSQFANLLSPRVERPVQDRTGLAGNFYVDLQWRAEPGPLGSPDAGLADRLPSSIFTALQEQLGLKLESIRGSANILVIDRAELPRAN